MSSEIRAENLACPLPLADYPAIVLGHGSGGKLSAELIEHLFLPAFRNDILATLGDAAVFDAPAGRLAFTTDSYVVRPLFFPGGSLGELAVYGTVNDLAMSGAQPLYLSAGFILEEGFPLASLARVVERMGEAARRAGIRVVAGDTKVVEKGHGDGCYINTTGLGVIPDGVRLAPNLAQPGDAVLVSGPVGNHGMAILSVRAGLEFESAIQSDTAPLHGLVQTMLESSADIHVLRDPTRGGIATALNEIAARSRVGVVLDEQAIPIDPAVQAACDVLGLDPLLVANEGKLVAIVASQAVTSVLDGMRRYPLSQRACVIGRVTKENPGKLIIRTEIGGSRLLPLPILEQMPRIC